MIAITINASGNYQTYWSPTAYVPFDSYTLVHYSIPNETIVFRYELAGVTKLHPNTNPAYSWKSCRSFTKDFNFSTNVRKITVKFYEVARRQFPTYVDVIYKAISSAYFHMVFGVSNAESPHFHSYMNGLPALPSTPVISTPVVSPPTSFPQYSSVKQSQNVSVPSVVLQNAKYVQKIKDVELSAGNLYILKQDMDAIEDLNLAVELTGLRMTVVILNP